MYGDGGGYDLLQITAESQSDKNDVRYKSTHEAMVCN